MQLDLDKARNAAKQARARVRTAEDELAMAKKRLELAKQRPGSPMVRGPSPGKGKRVNSPQPYRDSTNRNRCAVPAALKR